MIPDMLRAPPAGAPCLCRQFRLYLRTNDQLFADDFRAVVVDEDGQERSYPVDRHSYFTGHVIGEDIRPEPGSSCSLSLTRRKRRRRRSKR